VHRGHSLIERKTVALQDSLPIATPEGYFVSREHQRIAEIIQDYDPSLHLVFIPPANRDHNDLNEKPFAVAHIQPDGKAYIAFFSDTCDERILERLFRNDTHKRDVLSDIQASEAAHEAVKLYEQMELEGIQQDIAATLIKSPLHTFSLNGKKLQL